MSYEIGTPVFCTSNEEYGRITEYDHRGCIVMHTPGGSKVSGGLVYFHPLNESDKEAFRRCEDEILAGLKTQKSIRYYDGELERVSGNE